MNKTETVLNINTSTNTVPLSQETLANTKPCLLGKRQILQLFSSKFLPLTI